MKLFRAAAAIAALLGTAAMDPKNPTCPQNPDWSAYPAMRFTAVAKGGGMALLAEGRIDDNLLPRLQKALKDNSRIDEIWLRSSGGNAQVGNEAGKLIRKAGIPTRIPKGWACFSACNFIFMGGPIRVVDSEGLFIVHMFTFTADGGILADEVSQGYDAAVETIGQVERDAAMLASDDNDFLIRMGVSRKLLTEVMYRQKAVAGKGPDQSTRRCLTQAEVFKYNVANFR